MLIAFDTWYFDDKAKTVALLFEPWTATAPYKVYAEVSDNPEAYVPGEFYRRELPGILRLWDRVKEKEVEAIIIDGFVYLDDNGRYGLGGYLYEQLRIPVIGVAKSDYVTLHRNKRPLLRGNSKRPLYITAMGMDLDKATARIRSMAGAHRIPTLLKELDRLTRMV